MSVFKGARVSRCQCLKEQRVTRVPRLKGQLRDRVFLRSHLRSSLTPEEGPSCLLYKVNKLKSAKIVCLEMVRLLCSEI